MAQKVIVNKPMARVRNGSCRFLSILVRLAYVARGPPFRMLGCDLAMIMMMKMERESTVKLHNGFQQYTSGAITSSSGSTYVAFLAYQHIFFLVVVVLVQKMASGRAWRWFIMSKDRIWEANLEEEECIENILAQHKFGLCYCNQIMYCNSADGVNDQWCNEGEFIKRIN